MVDNVCFVKSGGSTLNVRKCSSYLCDNLVSQSIVHA